MILTSQSQNLLPNTLKSLLGSFSQKEALNMKSKGKNDQKADIQQMWDTEKAQPNKKSFFIHQQAKKVQYKQAEKIIQEKEVKNFRGLRNQIEDENEMENLFQKLTTLELDQIRSRVDENTRQLKILDKKNKFKYKLDDLEKKKKLMQYFLNTKRISNHQGDTQSSQYFEYRDKYIGKTIITNEQKFLTLENPFFVNNLITKQSSPKPIIKVSKKSPSYLRVISKLKQQIAFDSNVDKHLLTLQKQYDQSSPSKRLDDRNNLGLTERIDLQGLDQSALPFQIQNYPERTSYLNKNYQNHPSKAIQTSINSSRLMICSKHNMFRSKPDKLHLKSYLYANKSHQSPEKTSNNFILKQNE